MPGRKLRRLAELADLALRVAADQPSRRAILSCYADLGGAVTDGTEIDLRIRCGSARRACRMRRSDIFTLAEIFHEGQYRTGVSLPSAPTIVDAGANVGIASLWMSGRWPGATLHAFEPEADNFRMLERNLRELDGASAVRSALGDTDGEILLEISDHGAMHTTSRERGVPVPCLRLDSYMEARGVDRVDLLKLDVEGAELQVLVGLGDRITDVGAIVGEVHERAVDVEAFYDYLKDKGFTEVRRIPFRDGVTEGVHGFEASRWRA